MARALVASIAELLGQHDLLHAVFHPREAPSGGCEAARRRWEHNSERHSGFSGPCRHPAVRGRVVSPQRLTVPPAADPRLSTGGWLEDSAWHL
jgi:hypothetical protein